MQKNILQKNINGKKPLEECVDYAGGLCKKRYEIIAIQYGCVRSSKSLKQMEVDLFGRLFFKTVT